MPLGSSLKICLAADGDVDIYPRFGPTSEWDIAAANAVLSMPGAFSRFRITSKISLWKARFCLKSCFIAISPYINA